MWVVRFTPQPLYPSGERAVNIHWKEGWVGPRTNVDDVEKKKFYRDSNSDPSVFQPVASYRTDWAIPATQFYIGSKATSLERLRRKRRIILKNKALKVRCVNGKQCWYFRESSCFHLQGCRVKPSNAIFGLLGFSPEHGGSVFMKKVGELIPEYTAPGATNVALQDTDISCGLKTLADAQERLRISLPTVKRIKLFCLQREGLLSRMFCHCRSYFLVCIAWCTVLYNALVLKWHSEPNLFFCNFISRRK
jgi:hypothetical protein